MSKKSIYLCIVLTICTINVFAENIILSDESIFKKIGKNAQVLNDAGLKYDSNTVIHATGFYDAPVEVPVFSSVDINLWVRFSILNNTSIQNIYFNLDHANTSLIIIYKDSANKLVRIYSDGNAIKHNAKNTLPNYFANLNQQQNSLVTYYIHIQSYHPTVLDMYVGSYGKTLEQSDKKLYILLLYLGILMAIFFYNLFLYFVTKDLSYLLYISYIFFLATAQFTLTGYLFKFIWFPYPSINYYAVPVTTSLAIIAGILFSVNFLRTKHYTPVIHKIFLAALCTACLGILLSILGLNSISYFAIIIIQAFVSALGIIAAIKIVFQGHRPAAFYAVSWIFFVAALIIFSMRNAGLIPANNFTNYILYIGSSIETVLLSIALADKINVLKKEKDQSQAEALEQARMNERLVNEQNVILEEKVTQRTAELQNANTHLNEALTNLKDAQTQLVEAEKMASLGQLTAGIAHEINNPINFVKSNINPLKLDIEDLLAVLNEYNELHTLNGNNNYIQKLETIQGLKEEIDIDYVHQEINNLIAGIEEGAERTAEIVRGLRTFSRIDEAELKVVNIHEGILSTIVLLKNIIPYYLKLVKDFDAEGIIECFPGKLNQVFMNILTNAIQAIIAKPVKENETLIIKTRDVEDNQIEISIKDSGIGMDEEVKHRIFEPFFTTKDVGEGTGLGMAIVFKIIEKHAGKINIITSPGEGAEFIITLPRKFKGEP